MDDLIIEEEEDLDFVTYCSNVESQDELYRTFIKLCAFSPAPSRRSELILPLSREEDLITLPDESEPQIILPGNESEHQEDPDRGEDSPDVDLVTVFPANRDLPASSTVVPGSCLPTPTSFTSDRTLHIPTSPLSIDQIHTSLLSTSNRESPPPPLPPPPPSEPESPPPPLPPPPIYQNILHLRPPQIPERIPLPPHNHSEPPPSKPPRPSNWVSLQNLAIPESAPATSDPNSSGTLTRNLNKNMPVKTYALKDKSLVKSPLGGSQQTLLGSQQSLCLSPALFLRRTSCQAALTSPVPRLRGLTSEMGPDASNSYSMVNLSELPSCGDSTLSSKVIYNSCSCHSFPLNLSLVVYLGY